MVISTTLLYLLNVLALVGIILAFAIPIATLIWYFKKRKIIKKIPDKIKNKLNNERRFKENEIQEAKGRYDREEREYTRDIGTGEYRRGIGDEETFESSRSFREPIGNLQGTASIQERGSVQALSDKRNIQYGAKSKVGWTRT